MCWPSIEGGIEIEERRRKYKNEPRRKRLHFVKDRSSGHSDEWDLIQPRPREVPEMWEHPRPHPLPFDHRLQVEDPRWAAHLRQQPPPQQIHGPIPPPPHHGPPPQMTWRPQEHLQYYPDHGHPEDIVEEFRPEHDQHQHQRLPPRIIEAHPRIARMPSHLRARSRSRGRGYSRGGSSGHSLFSDESSYRGSHRGRRRGDTVFNDDDSFIEPRKTVRRVTHTTRR